MAVNVGVSDMWHVTGDTLHVTPETWHLVLKKRKKRIFLKSIGALTHTRREIQFQPTNESRITKETNIHNFKTKQKRTFC